MSTKALASIILLAGVALENDQVAAAFTALAKAHPRLTPWLGLLLTVGALLRNPRVHQVLEDCTDDVTPAPQEPALEPHP